MSKKNKDISCSCGGGYFSLRAAGICIHKGSVLLQKEANADEFAFPGGQIAFGETGEQTLIREFNEEMGAEIEVERFKWASEIFFEYNGKKCHQICLFYDVSITDEKTPKKGMFLSREIVDEREDIEFCWIPIDMLGSIKLYPENIVDLLRGEEVVSHFIYREESNEKE